MTVKSQKQLIWLIKRLFQFLNFANIMKKIRGFNEGFFLASWISVLFILVVGVFLFM